MIPATRKQLVVSTRKAPQARQLLEMTREPERASQLDVEQVQVPG